MGSSYGLFGLLGWVLFIFVPSWGRILYIRAFEYILSFFDNIWESTWRLLLLAAAIEVTVVVSRYFGLKYRKGWISFLIGIFLGGLFQVLLAIFVFGFKF